MEEMKRSFAAPFREDIFEHALRSCMSLCWRAFSSLSWGLDREACWMASARRVPRANTVSLDDRQVSPVTV
jgi:hypothetical protein